MAHIPHDNTVTMIVFSPDGTRLVTVGTDHLVRVWDAASSQEIARIPTGRIRVFNPDKSQLATAGGGPTVQLLDMATGAELARMRHDNQIETITFNPNGSQLATRVGKAANLWVT